MPASPARANKCSIPFVEPPSAFSIVMAFSNASNVSMSEGLIPFSNSFTHATPLSYTICCRRGSSAGGLALPGRASPITSDMDAIVFAVNMPPQEPAEGQAASSMFFSDSRVI